MDIDIDKYLSEEQKEQIAIQEWKKLVRAKMVDNFKENHTDAVKNYERVISNSIHRYLSSEIDYILNTDHKRIIEKGVRETLENHNFSFTLFRKKDAWDRERSPGQQALIDAVKNNQPLIKRKVKEHINSLTKEELLGGIDEVLEKIIKEKLNK